MGAGIVFAVTGDIQGFGPAMGPFCKEGGASLHNRAEVGAWGASLRAVVRSWAAIIWSRISGPVSVVRGTMMGRCLASLQR